MSPEPTYGLMERLVHQDNKSEHGGREHTWQSFPREDTQASLWTKSHHNILALTQYRVP